MLTNTHHHPYNPSVFLSLRHAAPVALLLPLPLCIYTTTVPKNLRVFIFIVDDARNTAPPHSSFVVVVAADSSNEWVPSESIHPCARLHMQQQHGPSLSSSPPSRRCPCSFTSCFSWALRTTPPLFVSYRLGCGQHEQRSPIVACSGCQLGSSLHLHVSSPSSVVVFEAVQATTRRAYLCAFSPIPPLAVTISMPPFLTALGNIYPTDHGI